MHLYGMFNVVVIKHENFRLEDIKFDRGLCHWMWGNEVHRCSPITNSFSSGMSSEVKLNPLKQESPFFETKFELS